MKDIRSELCQLIYPEEIYPKNLCLEREPMKHADYKEQLIDKQIDLMFEKISGKNTATLNKN